MRVLVIGSRGFTGRYVCGRLRCDPGVVLFEASDYGVDLCQPSTIRRCLTETGPDRVVNLAAVSFVHGAEYRRIYEVNAFGHLNLLRELERIGFDGRLIFASSANIYGNKTPHMISEDWCPRPVNHYSCSKVLAENFCELFKRKFEICIVRPFSCIGVGQGLQFLVPKIVAHFCHRRAFIELGNLDIERDFSDIRDIAGMYELLLHTDKKMHVIHFCSNETHSITHIISLLKEISGHKIEVRRNPEFVREEDLVFQRGSNERILSLGFARKYSMRETLEWMYSG